MPRHEWVKFIRRSIVRGAHATYGAVAVRRAMWRHATPLKLANLIAVKAQKRLRVDRMRGMPYRYKVDPTNVCRMSCPLCPTGIGVVNRRRGFMDLSLYRSLIDQIAPYSLILDLFGWGEPMLHHGLPAMIRYASERNLFTRFSSAFGGCDRGRAEALVASGLDAIVIAVDGASEETYRAYRRGCRLADVVASTDRLLAARARAATNAPHVTIRMLVSRHNEHEIRDVKRLAAEHGVDAFTVGTLALNAHDIESRRAWLPVNPLMNDYTEGPHNKGCCDDLWESMVINWDGRSAPCCWIYDSRHDLGDVRGDDLESLWNSPAYVASRRAAAGRAPRRNDPPVICDRCRGRPGYLSDARKLISRSG
ncbi:SPASM domain-containing protein [bacterium]|nr:SPASM domain-containing protein [bacterium]MBU1074309.1 SPASM domain-containing protein [bacterium]MBU1677218.1 SPASM domain-containing protein [bacterium]